MNQILLASGQQGGFFVVVSLFLRMLICIFVGLRRQGGFGFCCFGIFLFFTMFLFSILGSKVGLVFAIFLKY